VSGMSPSILAGQLNWQLICASTEEAELGLEQTTAFGAMQTLVE
jgi:hypothetical protein